MTRLGASRGQPRRTAHEYVRDSVRQAILRGELPGGTRLVQSALAEDLDVSTTPVREALRDLATEGLIDLDPHRGAIVRQLSFDEIRELQDLCMLLEPLAMRQMADVVTDTTVRIAEDIAAEMEVETDVGRWADLNRQLHATLVRDLEGTRLVSILRGLRDSAAPYIGLALLAADNQLEVANQDHRNLIEALKRRDADELAELSRRHAELTTKVLVRSWEHSTPA